MRMRALTQMVFLLPFVLPLLTGCGGTKVLKKSEPLVVSQAIASASDERLIVTLDWVVVRNGPGTWAKNADWDEYLLRVENVTDQPLKLTGLTVVDSLATPVQPEAGRKKLVRSSKETVKRYKKNSIRIKAGSGSGTLLAAGAAATVVGVGAAQVVAYSAVWTGSSAGAAATAAGGLLLLGPALVIGGVVRGVNNNAVDAQIQQRHTALPVEVEAKTVQPVDVFFPIAPSPQRLEITYTDSVDEHRIVIDTTDALRDLHINAPTD